MHGGTVVSVGYDPDGLGYFATIQSFVNGEYYTHQYSHLQDAGRPNNGSQIIAGQMIGLQGLSGNLRQAIRLGYTTPHTHVIVRKRIGAGWDLKNDYSNPINPEQIMSTKFDQHGNPIPGTDC
jgi:murein DD-endopeptidase MepM/ murein hydrolase activator NlpD